MEKRFFVALLLTGAVMWRPEKPYKSSGREHVQVELGLDEVMG